MDASLPSAATPAPAIFRAACAIAPLGGCSEVMTDDSDLLRRYVQERSQSAFTELVQRKTGLVYSAALRQVSGDTLLAQDVSQSVFIDLARKAPSLLDRAELTSWLYTSTRFAAHKALRAKHRRAHREQEAHTMQENDRDTLTETDWQKLRPILDDAICDLPDHDRSAVLMRYFEGQPFASMGEKLGIGESSARMRAERALDKLRGLLLRRGITSTAAALALALATKAVAAPPAGLAATLATGALAPSAAAVGVGTGAGLATKLYQLVTMNKISAAMAAATTIGAAGVASYESGEDAASTAFIVYCIFLGVGLLFSILSALGAHVFGGHGELGHDVHGSVGHGHAQGHADAGGGAHDMPGFAPLSPTTVATFITAFGGFGIVFSQFPATRTPWLSAPLATLVGFISAFIVFLFFRAVFMRTQASSEGRVADLVGHEATVITPISVDGVGEIAYVQHGSRYSAPARADDFVPHVNGAAVRITRIVGAQFYVVTA